LDGGLWIWSIGDNWPAVAQSNKSPEVADGLRLAKWPPNQQKHSTSVSSIAFTGDGKVAASCSDSLKDRFVLVWDTATGTVLRKLDIDVKAAGPIRAWAVAISSSGDWILCAGSVGGNDSDDGFVNLWGPSSQQVYFGEIKRQSNIWAYQWGATIHQCSSQDRFHGAIFVKTEEDGYEMYEWALSLSLNPEIIVTATTTATENVASKTKQARQGSRDLVLQRDGVKILNVRNAGLRGGDCCTCKATAVFDSIVQCKSAWSDETTAQPADRANTSPKVAVGLRDGTVHFMELHNGEDGNLHILAAKYLLDCPVRSRTF
jgi:WD40 repeat protein